MSIFKKKPANETEVVASNTGEEVDAEAIPVSYTHLTLPTTSRV